ncbi:TerC family protein [Sporolactobacillus spathodeae]|uniref:YjbE family integral membrane protein n=1 Tax=Sporolactobacillus spathodeae TaxID=1465502 RepID=A0ABS2Q4J3_9BACL|nr:TerC family protein [Sporolactobacillus spathodeae]MBM7656691.1 YjbE family integral membrane protein [Sporolactobacillus spathodeae]
MSLDYETMLFIVKIIFIDIILGGDNAVVIALACRRLPERKRNKAIFLGTGIAVIVRICLTAIVVSLLNIPFLLFAGGCFLIVIAFRLITNREEKIHVQAGTSLFIAVRTIVFADIVMGLDNMLAIAGAAHGHIGYIAIGLLVSVPIIVWGSKLILIAMEHFPVLVYLGGAVLLYTASEMILSEPKLLPLLSAVQGLAHLLPLVLIASVLLLGWLMNLHTSRQVSEK